MWMELNRTNWIEWIGFSISTLLHSCAYVLLRSSIYHSTAVHSCRIAPYAIIRNHTSSWSPNDLAKGVLVLMRSCVENAACQKSRNLSDNKKRKARACKQRHSYLLVVIVRYGTVWAPTATRNTALQLLFGSPSDNVQRSACVSIYNTPKHEEQKKKSKPRKKRETMYPTVLYNYPWAACDDIYAIHISRI